MIPEQLSWLDITQPEEELARRLVRQRIQRMSFYKRLGPRKRRHSINRDVDGHWRSMAAEARARLTASRD